MPPIRARCKRAAAAAAKIFKSPIALLGQKTEVMASPDDADGHAIDAVPSQIADAVLKRSQALPEGFAEKVAGIDFDRYAGRDVTVDELVGGMANMGFQASSLGDAVKVVDRMVRLGCFREGRTGPWSSLMWRAPSGSDLGATSPPAKPPPSCSATPRTSSRRDFATSSATWSSIGTCRPS